MTGLPLNQGELVALVQAALKEFIHWKRANILDSDIEAWLGKQQNPLVEGRICGYCGNVGADVNGVSYVWIGGRGNVPFWCCDDGAACSERQEKKPVKCERCEVVLLSDEAY